MKGSRTFSGAALGLSLGYIVCLVITADSVGFVRDEGYYFKAAQQYSEWFGVLFSSRFFEAFTDPVIQKHLSYNVEHPPLVKYAQGFTFHLFSEWTGLMSPSKGFRMAGILFGGLSVWSTFLLGREVFDERVGLIAAASLTVLPRYFFDAHLACFDVPVTAMWTLCLVRLLKTFRQTGLVRLRSTLLTAFIFGLALATKLNILFLPGVFGLAWLLSGWREFGWRKAPSSGLNLPAWPRGLGLIAVLGVAVFFLSWPYLWHEPGPRLGAYLSFHLNHEHYPASYLQQFLVAPPFPWLFPVVMSALTVPIPIFLLGSAELLRQVMGFRSMRFPIALLMFSVIVPVFMIALPTSPIFGGVKHWYPAMPGLCILAGRAFSRCLDLWAGRAAHLRWVTTAGAVALLLTPGVLGIVATHPYGISAYNSLAGGVRGAASLGMQRGFWGGLSSELYEGLAAEGSRASYRVFFNRTNYDSYRMYRREGRFPDKVRYANSARQAEAGVHFEQPEHGEQEGQIWTHLGTQPTRGVYLDNVTLIQMYEKALHPSR